MELGAVFWYSKNEWAPVHQSIAGPCIFVIGEGVLVKTSIVSGSGSAWPLRSSPAECSNCWKARWGWQLLTASTAPWPCDEQGHQSDPVASCSSSRVADGLSSASVAWCLDRM